MPYSVFTRIYNDMEIDMFGIFGSDSQNIINSLQRENYTICRGKLDGIPFDINSQLIPSALITKDVCKTLKIKPKELFCIYDKSNNRCNRKEIEEVLNMKPESSYAIDMLGSHG